MRFPLKVQLPTLTPFSRCFKPKPAAAAAAAAAASSMRSCSSASVHTLSPTHTVDVKKFESISQSLMGGTLDATKVKELISSQLTSSVDTLNTTSDATLDQSIDNLCTALTTWSVHLKGYKGELSKLSVDGQANYRPGPETTVLFAI